MADNTALREQLKKIHSEVYKVEVQVLEGGAMPLKKNYTDAGFDLIASEDIKLYPGQVLKHPLNIRLRLPANTYAEITTKSGLGSKGHLVYAGIIDEQYRGIPHVLMTNLNQTRGFSESFGSLVANVEPLVIKKGEKVAQLIMHPYNSSYFVEQVETVDTNTDRGEGGFGSTGK